jgi:hypothetical protein
MAPKNDKNGNKIKYNSKDQSNLAKILSENF